jgi:hypothetical protein
MKTIKLESSHDLDALMNEIQPGEQPEPVSLTRGDSQVAVIVSSAEY